jgi:hypothetical protein
MGHPRRQPMNMERHRQRGSSRNCCPAAHRTRAERAHRTAAELWSCRTSGTYACPRWPQVQLTCCREAELTPLPWTTASATTRSVAPSPHQQRCERRRVTSFSPTLRQHVMETATGSGNARARRTTRTACSRRRTPDDPAGTIPRSPCTPVGNRRPDRRLGAGCQFPFDRVGQCPVRPTRRSRIVARLASSQRRTSQSTSTRVGRRP